MDAAFGVKEHDPVGERMRQEREQTLLARLGVVGRMLDRDNARIAQRFEKGSWARSPSHCAEEPRLEFRASASENNLPPTRPGVRAAAESGVRDARPLAASA